MKLFKKKKSSALKDRNGKEILEGDIVRGVGKHRGQSEVFYKYGVWQPFEFLDDFKGQNFEVIGNAVDNPELLERRTH